MMAAIWFGLGLATAAFSDWRSRRIPNWLTSGLALSGLLWRMAAGEPPALLGGVLGGAFLLLLFFGLFALQVARGGDGKLAAAAGVWIGWDDAWTFFLLWLGANAIAFFWVSLRAHRFSVRSWWQEQRVGVEGLLLRQFHRHGGHSYPGALSILAAVLVLWLVRGGALL